MALYTYNANNVVAVLGGKLLSGFADGTFITVEQNADTWIPIVGTDGNVTRARSNDTSGKLTIMLQQSSPSNSYLMSLATADALTGKGAVPFLLRDTNGETLISALQVFNTKPPSVEYSREVTNRSWDFYLVGMTIFVGGNA